MRKKNLLLICLMGVLATALFCGASVAQQAASPDIRQLIPASSLAVVVFDTRAENASVQVILKCQDPKTQALRAEQQAAMRKAIENLSTLFGISLDFAKDIDSWADQQWALVVLPDEKAGVQPVFMMASTDAAAAGAALQKILAPFQRVGEVTPQLDADYSITGFKNKDKGVEVYASAFGQVAALSPSKAALKQALSGKGFASGSAGYKVLAALSDSVFCAYMDPALLKVFHALGIDIPVSGVGLGVSAVETGVKLRLLGYPNEDGAALLRKLLSAQQPGVLTANTGIPSGCLVAASLPSLRGLESMAGMMGMGKNPVLQFALGISDMQVSAAVTAALPCPAGVVSAIAESEEIAAEKLVMIAQRLKQAKLPTMPESVSGVQADRIDIPNGRTAYLARIGKHVVLASDVQSLTGTVATIKGEAPALSQSNVYKETMAGLGNSNLLTTYLSLAPVQGLGYLVEGLGIGQLMPPYGAIAKGLENMQALGIGAGFDGEAVSATMFLRARPGMGGGAGTAAIGAMGAAVLFPVFARAREAAQMSACASNLKELAVVVHVYSNDNMDKLPPAASWRSALKPYRPEAVLKCPSGNTIYAFNKNLGGLALDKIPNPSEVVLFFEADRNLPNASGSRADARLSHKGMGWFAFADGHVMRLSEAPGQSKWVVKSAAPKQTKKAAPKKAPVKARGHR